MALHEHDTISRKISHLKKKEGKTAAQAVGQALGMARAGSLGKAAKQDAPKRKHGQR